MPLADPDSGIFVQDITGLDPGAHTLDGRSLKFMLGLNPDYIVDSVQDIRRRLYKFFMLGASPKLRFHMTDGQVVEISGKVEAFEAPLFVEEPRAVISILCEDERDFVDPTIVELAGVTSVMNNPDQVINYEGNVPTGVVFTLNVDRLLPSFSLIQRFPDNTIQSMDFSDPLSAGDVLTISTVPGAKGVTLLREGTERSVLYGVSPKSKWFELRPGANYYTVFAEGVADVPYTMQYLKRYGGL